MKKKSFTLPDGCLCPQCPHFHECMSLAQKVFGDFQQTEKNVDFKQFQATVDKLAEKLQTNDFLEVLFAYGGLMFGRKLKEWLKQNYKPLRRKSK